MLKALRWRWLAHAAMWLVVAGITAFTGRGEQADMGETPKRPCGRRVKQPSGADVSALADAFPGVALLERAAVVRIEAVAASGGFFLRTIVAADC